MSHHRGQIALQVALALTLLAAACSGGPGEQDASPWVEIRGTRVVVEIVRGEAEQARGLSGRRSLEWGHGMLFPYDSPRLLRFWMKDMNFDIDIVWIRDGRIIDVSHRVPRPEPGAPSHEIPTAQPAQLADAVLEVPAGYAAANSWRYGDSVTLGPL